MNIFYLHPDPYEAAAYHYDKHKVKMILEAAQMLCTAHRMYNLDYECEDIPYKKAHVNHPSTVWARQSGQNYYWLYHYMIALGDEYTKRYGKTHLTITKCKKPLAKYPHNHHNVCLMNIKLKVILLKLIGITILMIRKL